MVKKIKKAKVVKKAVKHTKQKPVTAPKELRRGKEGKLIGEVCHYFSNIEVAVVKLSAPLAIGDQIRIVGGENTDFNQEVESIQMEHEKLTKAKKGQEVGMKVKEKAREGYKVYKQ